LVASLSNAAEEERVLHASPPAASASDRELLRGTLREAYSGRRAPRWRTVGLVAAAAAICAVIGTVLWRAQSPSPRRPEFMGSPQTSVVYGLEREGLTYRWKCSAPADQFTLRFYSASNGERSSNVLASRTVLDETWLTLTDSEAAQVAPPFVWEVSAYRLGELVGAAESFEAP